MTEEFDDGRLDELVDVIVRLASGNLGARLEPSAARDSVDAVITGINLLAEELDVMYRTLEQRVAERTALLDQARRDMERLALNDALTGLANRTLLGQRIRDATARAEHGCHPPCVLLLDLDEFKTINDGLGHSAGDRILVEVAHRLTSVVRDVDTVARLGGDEFAVLLPDVTRDHALSVAHRALKELQRPFSAGERAVWTGASVGVRFAEPGQTADLLLRDADIAMYAAKAQGRGNVQVFRPEMHQATRARLQVASELGAAIARGQLRLHFQPIAALSTGEIVAAEALVRWAHPTRGLLEPADFLTIAEDSGHIIELGHWVVQAAAVQLQRWQAIFPHPRFQLHLNLSPTEIRWPGLVEYVQKVLETSEVSPERIAFEISETGLMTGDAAALDNLNALRSLGVGLAIDDFGTGYSSISYLQRLPVDTVKVDQALIRDLTKSTHVAFVGAVLHLIEAAGLRAVVEGIETVDQMEELQGLGCLYGQGHLLSHPVPADGMTRMLSDGLPPGAVRW